MAETVSGHSGHIFGLRRPSAGGDYTVNGEQVRDTHFRELPEPTGSAPYRLDLKDVISAQTYDAIVAEQRLTFHLNGDIGGIGSSMQQDLVATGMETDLAVGDTTAGRPAFLYLTGDCVYYNGEVADYYAQFYGPYKHYTVPIFAVPGNHDGENVQGDVSLNGFVRNFCAATPTTQPESGDSLRTAMVQPNVYWTLLTPVMNIVGLYSNVPEGGEIRSPQLEWLSAELHDLPATVPLVVALHHPIYSADNYHSGSAAMKAVIESAAARAGRHPDLVVAGHVHDYQRLTKKQSDGNQIPYLVTGAGGYPNLHSIQKDSGQRMITSVTFQDNGGDPVTLESYVDDHHGFLRLEVTPQRMTGKYYQVPRPHEPYSKGSQLVDYFAYKWTAKKYEPNRLP